MKLSPYLMFNGDCAEAFKFYEQTFGGKILGLMTNGTSPMAHKTAPELKDKIMHAALLIGDVTLMGADAPPGRYEKPQGIHVTVAIATSAESERVFAALAEKATIIMPIQQTFWTARFGMLVDRFGIPWMINCDQPA